MEHMNLKKGLVFALGLLTGAAWLFGAVLPAIYLDAAFYSENGPTLDLGLLILLFSFLFGAAGALLAMLAGRGLPEAPYTHLLGSAVFVLFTAAYIDGPVAFLQMLFEQKFWAFMFGAGITFLVARRMQIFRSRSRP